jgi:hypothetical protein
MIVNEVVIIRRKTMFNTTHNRNRHGAFSPKDCERKSTEQRAEFQTGVAQLMAKQAPVVIVHSNVDRRAQEIEVNRTKLEAAKAKGNQFQINLYSAEIARLEAK